MAAWIDDFAAEFDLPALDPQEVNELLGAAREVAHRVERKATPLATFLVGLAVARREAAGEPRSEALAAVLTDLKDLLPEEQPTSGG